jgi:transcriptional regulator GlxA family with amidase domain
LFDDVEELDAVGPWEVVANWTLCYPEDGWSVSLISRDGQAERAAKGLALVAYHSFDTMPPLEVLIHPGGPGTRRLMHDHHHLKWVRQQRATVPLLTSVCTGALVYTAAGVPTGRPVTIHWASLGLLESLDPSMQVADDNRFIDDGDLITSAGVSAGIDMALHLVNRLCGVGRSREVRRDIAYDPQPPV